VGELPERQNLIASLDGTRPGPTLTLTGHLDVVPADAGEWSVPPFAGVIKDGYVWGCGATDMKEPGRCRGRGAGAPQTLGSDFAGTIKFAATADEEDGEYCGVRWLCRNHPESMRCDYLLNEGMGGLWMPVGANKVFLLAAGERPSPSFVSAHAAPAATPPCPRRNTARSSIWPCGRRPRALRTRRRSSPR